MLFRKDHIKKLTAALGMSKGQLLARVRAMHPDKRFSRVVVVADEESRYVAIAAYSPEATYRGHPPSLAFAIYKSDARVEEIDRAGYGLGIK